MDRGTSCYDSAVSTTLTRNDVERIAALAHLELTEPEIERLRQQLGEVLTYFERLQQLDTTGIEATTHPVSAGPVMRPDTRRASMPLSETTANAPDANEQGLFRVPKVIG